MEYNIKKLNQFVTPFQFWLILVKNKRNLNIRYTSSQPTIHHLLISFTLVFSIIRIWWFQGKILSFRG